MTDPAVNHAERAAEMLAGLDTLRTLDPATMAQAAGAHATLALVAAVESWQPPAEPATEPVPFEHTAAGFDDDWNS